MENLQLLEKRVSILQSAGYSYREAYRIIKGHYPKGESDEEVTISNAFSEQRGSSEYDN